MKRKTKTVMLAACALIVLGAAIFACAFAAADFDIHRLSTPEDSTREWHLEVVPSGEIERIRVNALADDIRICRSGTDEIIVTYYTSQYGSYELVNENGELTLEYAALKDRRWYEYLTVDFGGIHSDKNSIEIDIPAGYDGEVWIETATGSVELVNLEIDGMLSSKSTTGSMTLCDVQAASVEASVTTGEVELETVVTSGDISISFKTGGARLENVLSGGEVTARGTTGDIDMYIVEAESITAECTTGSINGYSVCSGSTALKATTGDINVNMRGGAEDYTVSTDVTAGDAEVDDADRANGEKQVTAATATGSIHIGFTD